jgi:CDP-glucose 4,6-dehydratase
MEGVVLNNRFWRGKRVFVTGHTGFKGSWLSLWLQELGAEVTGYALAPPTNPSLYELAHVEEGMTSHMGDIRDLSSLTAAISSTCPEIIIHMAAQPLVRHSYENPLETYSTNVMGVVNLFEAVRSTESVRVVLNITTDKCYENREWVWGYREDEPMGGRDPYSSSKGCAELITAAYKSSYFNPDNYDRHGVAIATARAGNVIGGGDWAKDRLIPDILRSFSNNLPVYVRNPTAIRPWQHVLEPLRGYLMLAECLYEHGAAFSQPWNFGPNDDDAKPVSWIIERMANLWGDGVSWEVDGNVHPHEANFLKLDISKARHSLGWTPILKLDHALEYIVDWAKSVRAGACFRDKTVEQIRIYQQLLS